MKGRSYYAAACGALMLVSAACSEEGTARSTFRLPDELPALTKPAHLFMRVEERSDPGVRGIVLGSAPAVAIAHDFSGELALPRIAIPNGDDRVVVAELRNAPS